MNLLTKEQVKAKIRRWVNSLDDEENPLQNIRLECTKEDYLSALREIIEELDTRNRAKSR